MSLNVSIFIEIPKAYEQINLGLELILRKVHYKCMFYLFCLKFGCLLQITAYVHH